MYGALAKCVLGYIYSIELVNVKSEKGARASVLHQKASDQFSTCGVNDRLRYRAHIFKIDPSQKIFYFLWCEKSSI